MSVSTTAAVVHNRRLRKKSATPHGNQEIRALLFSLWSSRDELPSGMDASQHKDYVLVPQLTKYVNKKYVRQPFAPINIPSSASLANMVAST